MTEVARTLESAVDDARALDAVRKTDIHNGDRVVVITRNSRYTIWALGNGLFWGLGWVVRIAAQLACDCDYQRLHLGRQCHKGRHYCGVWASIGVWKYSAHDAD